MRSSLVIIALLVGFASAIAQEAAKPLTPAEAMQKVDQKVTVEMEVKSTGGNTNRYLNSEADFRSAKNFAVFIPEAAVPKFRELVKGDPTEFYKGKTIQATGTVALATTKAANGRPQLRIEVPAQIKVIETPAKK